MRKESVIDYGEYIAAEVLLKHLNVSKNKFKEYSIFAPLSRQEKGVDLILYNRTSSKTATIQVKFSRSYVRTRKRKPSTNYLWFNNFKIDKEAKADFYILVGNYLKGDHKTIIAKEGLTVNAIDFSSIVLIYTYAEIIEELRKIRKKNKNEPDSKFGFEFRDENDIVLTRGYVEGYNTINNGSNERNEFLVKSKINVIKEFFTPQNDK